MANNRVGHRQELKRMNIDLELIASLILVMATFTAVVGLVGIVFMVVGLARLNRPTRHAEPCQTRI